MKMSLIKKALENNKSFQHLKKTIGLSFEDFSVLAIIKNKSNFLVLKEGKKDLGNYDIKIIDGIINCFCFDTKNDNIRQNRLNRIKSLKASE